MVRKPRVFLFDEPLSNLDARLRVQMRAEIKRLPQRVRATMIYVTHDQVEAMTLGDRIAVLRGGVLQQVADPATLDRNPANQFVAGFIGSPPINLFAAEVRGNGALSLDAAGVSIALSGEAADAVRPWNGRRVNVGVRPEDITLAAGAGDGRMPAKVEVCEPLGNEVLVHWDTPVGKVVSRVPGQKAPGEGESVTLHFALGKLHFFDPESERALGAAS